MDNEKYYYDNVEHKFKKRLNVNDRSIEFKRLNSSKLLLRHVPKTRYVELSFIIKPNLLTMSGE